MRSGAPGHAPVVEPQAGRDLVHLHLEAADFYTSLFDNSRILYVTHYGDAGPRPAGMVMTVYFELDGEEGQCGWLKDRFGVSWQVGPAILHELIQDPDRDKVERVVRAMLGMKKLDGAELLRAAEGG